jgi:argininosuccinate lyase
MHAADIRGSIAYAKALTLVGILTKDEESKIVQGLTTVGKEWEIGQVRFHFFPSDFSRWLLIARARKPVSGPAGRRGHSYRERTSLERTDRAVRRQVAHRSVQERPGRDGHAPLAPRTSRPD